MPSFKPVADHALLVEFGTEISEPTHAAVVALDKAIAAAAIPGVQEVVPAFVNLLILFDPLVTDHAALQKNVTGLLGTAATGQAQTTHHTVPVCFEAPHDIDLAAVAQTCGIAPEAVINAFLSGSYRIGMYGFAPGYAYMSGVPEPIQVPRKNAPVRGIPVGSVMIAGPQALITTLPMPTGWSIIGATPTRVLTGDTARPFLFDVGDTVTFTRIGLADV